MGEECSNCKEGGQPVSLGLVHHHLAKPWAKDLEGGEFSFCETPNCPTIYFASDGRAFDATTLRRAPAYKTGDEADLLCYCFDVTGSDALGDIDPVPYVRERVRNGECDCDVLNPSGACCLGSIGRWRKLHGWPRYARGMGGTPRGKDKPRPSAVKG